MSDYPSPGVYIVEDHSVSLRINLSDTAVPAFLCTAAEFTALTVAKGSDNQPVKSARIYAWLDVARIAEEDAKKKAKVVAKPATAAKSASLADTQIYRALQAYFENGGGPCYVLNGIDEAAADHIKILQDVTLLVQAGVDSSDGVTAFCRANRGVFGIIDAKVVAKGSSDALTKAQAGLPNVAAYYPSFIKAAVDKSVPASGAAAAAAASASANVPASAVMAGIYCRVDRERGVWKAPANVDVRGGLAVSEYLSLAKQEALYEKAPSINVIRGISGKAPIVWGARTLAAETEGDDFRYVPVRRLFDAVEKDIKATLSIAVFEPNSPPIWERVRGAIDNYLHALWKQGALIGDTPSDAYLVQVGLGVTMTDDDLRSGKMIVRVALAPSRPAEFIFLNFSQQVGLG